MIKLWNVNGQMKSDIGQLVRFYLKSFGRSYEAYLGKGVMGKRLETLLKETHHVSPENLIDNNQLGIHNKDGSLNIPQTYEEWNKKQIENSEKLGAASSSHRSSEEPQALSALQE